MATTRFTLQDNDGQDHLYEVQSISARKRFALKLKIAKVLGAAAGRGFSASGGKIDISAMLGAAEQIPSALEEVGGFDFIAEVFQGVTRVHYQVDDSNGRKIEMTADLSHEHELDAAYDVENQAEMYRAIAMILASRLTPFGKSGSPTWNGLSSWLMEKLPLRKVTSTETQKLSDDLLSAVTRQTD